MTRGTVLARAVGAGGLAWGALLLTRGDAVWRSVQGTPPDEVDELATRVLGWRHAAQGVAQLAAPRTTSGVVPVVDGAHAASMAVLAAASASRRRVAVLSGSVALAGALLTRAARRAG